MKINQEEIPKYLFTDISKFIRMEYAKSVFIIDSVKPIILPDKNNYLSSPYKFHLEFKYQGKSFIITVQYFVNEEDIKYGLQFSENVDYGEESASISAFYEYIKTSQKIVKQILDSARLPLMKQF